MLNYLNTQTKWHKVDYETLTDEVLRIIFVLYKDLDRKKAQMTHINYQNEQLKKQLNGRVETQLFKNVYETLEEICDRFDDLDKARNSIKDLMEE